MVKLSRTKGKFNHFEGEKVDTKFGQVLILKRTNRDITVLIEDDITATFGEREFFEEFIK